MSHWSNSSNTRTHSSLSFSHIHSADRQKNLLFQIVIECPGSCAGKGGETGAGGKVTRGAFTVLQRISLAFFPIHMYENFRCLIMSPGLVNLQSPVPSSILPLAPLQVQWTDVARLTALIYVTSSMVTLAQAPSEPPVQPSLVAIKRSSYVIVQGRRSSRERQWERESEREGARRSERTRENDLLAVIGVTMFQRKGKDCPAFPHFSLPSYLTPSLAVLLVAVRCFNYLDFKLIKIDKWYS